MTAILEAIAYGLARGFLRAWLEVQADLAAADQEVPDEKAIARRDKLRAAVKRLRESWGDTGQFGPPQGKPGNDDKDMGSKT